MERELVEGLRRREGAAFDRVYGLYRARLYGFLARVSGRRDLAEELLQETFLRLAARAAELRPDTHLSGWLFTVARNLWIGHLRATALEVERVDRAALADPTVPTPFEELAATETQRRLERALAAVPAVYREVLLLVVVERLEPTEAAAVIGLTPEALRQRLARARAMLEEALVDEPIRRRAAGTREP